MAVFTIAPEQWTEDMWREAIKAVVRFGAQPWEDLDDVVTAGWILGQRRAELQNRERLLPGVDPQYALDIFSWWPFKPTYSAQVLAEIIIPKRWEFVRGIRTNGEQSERLRNLIPDDILKMSIDDLYQRIAYQGGRELASSLKW